MSILSLPKLFVCSVRAIVT